MCLTLGEFWKTGMYCKDWDVPSWGLIFGKDKCLISNGVALPSLLTSNLLQLGLMLQPRTSNLSVPKAMNPSGSI